MAKMRTPKNTRKYFAAGGGGGAKSTIEALMASVSLWKGIYVELFDADPANPTLRRYFKDMPPESILRDSHPDAFPAFMEDRVWSAANPAFVDLGANMELMFLEWLNDRGATVAEDVRIIVPIHKKDGLSAASRIVKNRGDAKVLLVINEHGGADAMAAAGEPMFENLLDGEDVVTISFPRLGRTMEQIHRTSETPDKMLKSDNPFAAQGALNLLRKIEQVFEPVPEFRPW